MPLYVREAEVEQLLRPEDAVKEIEACFARMSRGRVAIQPRVRLGLHEGSLHILAAADAELGVAGFKAYVGFQAGARFVVGLFAHDRPELFALVEAGKLGQLRTGAASAVAARHLARSGATSLGVIGTGRQAESQVACILAGLPGIKRVVAYSRSAGGLADFCNRVGAEPADCARDAAEQDIVVTITTSSDPVLHGDWLRPGALVCAAGANRIDARELDDAVLARAAFVCCDYADQARLEAGDLVEPVDRGLLDWPNIHDLSEVVGGAVIARRSDDDIVVFKSVGIAAEDIAVAKFVHDAALSRGLGQQLSDLPHEFGAIEISDSATTSQR